MTVAAHITPFKAQAVSQWSPDQLMASTRSIKITPWKRMEQVCIMSYLRVSVVAAIRKPTTEPGVVCFDRSRT